MLRVNRLPAWLQGAIFGDAIWALAMLCAYTLQTNQIRFPRWMERLDLIDTIGSFFMIVGAPIAVGGWLMIWGDKGPPYHWLESIAFNISFAFCF